MELNGLIIENNGTKCWYFNGITHREDGPAVEYPEGTKKWYLNGNLHRKDGPAIQYADGNKEWWLEGNQMSEKEFNILKFNEKISKDLQIKTKMKKNNKMKV